jgi:AP-4 complex subunit epsilon-1
MSSLLSNIASGLEAPIGREFFDLVKAIGESKSKQEEDRIITEEIMYLKKILPSNGHSAKKLKELVVRSLYVEMLGQDGSFAYMRIVELCASNNIAYKKAGYLAASLTLHPGHEFRLMLVNRIQQDMKSTNMIESTTALSGVCRLVTEDMVPAVIGDVIKLLNHDMDPVRKKAVSALHRLYQLDKDSVADHYDKIRRVICDKDPAVMGAALGLILDLAKDDVSLWKDLVPSLVSILKQIIEHRLSKDFDYHRIPAPWLQMNLLRLLAVLGRGDQTCSEDMYEVLAEVMKRADTGINVGYAIVYEAVNTVTCIYPNTVLLDTAATAISRFIRSDSHNLKYIGVKGLAAIVKDHPRYAADHQMAVVDCLEDHDETLKRKTLSLLFRMTNSVNVEFIIKKLLNSLETATDDHFRTDLVGQIVQCAERYAPSNAWFVRTMIRVFELAGEKITNKMAQTLIQIIAEGSDDDDDDEGNTDEPNDDDLRAEAVGHFLILMIKPNPPELIIQTLCWVLGEYGYLSKTSTIENIVDSLCNLVKDGCTNNAARACVITAVMKLVAQMGHCPSHALQIIQDYQSSISIDVHQRCLLFNKLLKYPDTMIDVLPVDASCEDIEVDENLIFLNNYVNNAVSSGASEYSRPRNISVDGNLIDSGGLNFTPYERPAEPTAAAQGLLSGSSIGGNNDNMGGSGMQMESISSNSPSQAPLQSGGNALLGGAAFGKSGGPWSKTMEAPKPVQAQQTPAQRHAIEQAALEAERQKKEEEENARRANSSNYNTGTNSNSIVNSEPEKPREKTEKEKMAEALFGGFGGGSAPKTGVSSRRAARNTQSSAEASPVPVEQNIQQDSLLGDFGDDMILSSASVPPPAPACGGSDNLFDMDDLSLLSGGGDDLNAAPPVPPTPPMNADDDLLFGGMTLTSEAPTSPIAAASTTTPLKLTTPEFGGKWGICSCEVKESVAPCEIPSLSALQGVMESCGRYAHIESISASQEAIFAANASNATTILLHIKLEGNDTSTVTVRSTQQDISINEFAFLKNLIQNS